MLDRVREAMFSTLAPWVPGGRVLDLFAGSGSLGLEALSRGAARVRMIERDPRAATALVENVRALGLEDRVRVERGDALDEARWSPGVDVVFLDPPYPLLERPEFLRRLFDALETLAESVLVAEGVIVLHVPRGRLLRDAFPGALACRERVYGSSSLWYVQRGEGGGRTSEASA